LNGSVFYNDYKDFQARISAGSGDLGLPDPVLSVVNAGKLNIKGAELEASWTPIQGLLLDTQIGYLDAEYGKFFDDRFPNDSRAFQTPAFSPKWTVRYGAQYGFDIGSAGSITVGAQARYRSRTALAVDSTYVLYPTIGSPGIGTTTEVPGLFQPGYWLGDARIVWEDASKRFAVGLYGNNLTNKKYRTDAQEFSSVGEIRTVYYGNPRTVTLRLTARY
jgi:iron complex outermembrane receptor protein